MLRTAQNHLAITTLWVQDHPVDTQAIIIASLAMAVGGVLKGAAGAGAPVIAVPIIAIFFDVRFAVIVFAYPNLLSNIFQVIKYRGSFGPRRLWLGFGVGGLLGTILGSYLLVCLAPDTLMLILACFVVVYITFRLARPDWVLARTIGERYAGLVGAVAGVFYGAIALSAPISITFLNSMRLSRDEFIATISSFFLAMGLSQFPVLYALETLDQRTAVVGLTATGALFVGMPVGEWIARFMTPKQFDRVILVLLALIAARMFLVVFT